MREIPLTQGKFALVDDADFEWLNGFKWHARKMQKEIFYATTTVKGLSVNMQSMIMGTSPNRSLTIDHRDGNDLNNQRQNLRWATPTQQRQNSRIAKSNKCGFKGVRRVSDCRRKLPFQASIWILGKRQFLGYFPSAESAASAYNQAAELHYREFARLNPCAL